MIPPLNTSGAAHFAPKGDLWEKAIAYWRTLKSDEGAGFDKMMRLDAAQIKPQVTWGTSPEMVTAIDGKVPDPLEDRGYREAPRHGACFEIYGTCA